MCGLRPENIIVGGLKKYIHVERVKAASSKILRYFSNFRIFSETFLISLMSQCHIVIIIRILHRCRNRAESRECSLC